MYFAENTHKAIIPKDVFDKANEILEENRKKAKSSRKPPRKYIFTGKIKCLNCGKNYKRKIYQGKIFWSCTTYVEEGRNACPAKQIPEQILMSKTFAVLGITDFSEDLFREKIKQIIVPKHEQLRFVLQDGREIEVEWKNPSRRESWTEEKRQKARERTLNFWKEVKEC